MHAAGRKEVSHNSRAMVSGIVILKHSSMINIVQSRESANLLSIPYTSKVSGWTQPRASQTNRGISVLALGGVKKKFSRASANVDSVVNAFQTNPWTHLWRGFQTTVAYSMLLQELCPGKTGVEQRIDLRFAACRQFLAASALTFVGVAARSFRRNALAVVKHRLKSISSTCHPGSSWAWSFLKPSLAWRSPTTYEWEMRINWARLTRSSSCNDSGQNHSGVFLEAWQKDVFLQMVNVGFYIPNIWHEIL